jgi:Secretion system C-terminal sorting domain/GEVED domain
MNKILTIACLLATIHSASAQTCSGTPIGGMASASEFISCSTDTLILSVAGASSGAGIHYQWQYSVDSSTWTGIPGATSDTCAFTPAGAYSTIMAVGYTAACPCVATYYYSSYYSPSGYLMSLFQITGYGSSSILDVVDTTAYRNRPYTVTLEQAGTYAGIVGTGDTSYYSYYTYENQIWIDFNDDAVFALSEAVTAVFGTAAATTSFPFSAHIPFSAPVGLHRMRVRNVYTSVYGFLSPELDPCKIYDSTGASYKYYYSGTTRDYGADIILLPPCSGSPVAGIAMSSSAILCSADTLTLNLSDDSLASGLSYQWYYSTDSSSWSELLGATTRLYQLTPTGTYFYHCKVTCGAGGGSAISEAIKVAITATCPCIPEYKNGYLPSYLLTYFSLTGYSGAFIHDSGAYPATGYEDRTGAFAPVLLQQGATYYGYVYTEGFYYYENQIWIDFNDDGSLTAAESVTDVFGGRGSAFTFTLRVPHSAGTGYHLMRLRNAYTNTPSISSAMDPCNDNDASLGYHIYYLNGSTWDYAVQVVKGSSAGVPAVTNSAITYYPNPVSDFFTINTDGATYNMEVVNSVGQQMITRTFNGASNVVNVSTLPTGVYYLKLTSNDGGAVSTEKFVKE